MEKIGTEFYCSLNDNYYPTIHGWEEECSVCYPKNIQCLECKNHGLWRSRIGTEHYGIPRSFNESILENMGHQIYVPPNQDNYICIIPCFECAKNHKFTWGKKIIDENNTIPIDCNGVNPYGEINNELSLHDLSIYLIKRKIIFEHYLHDRNDNDNDNENIMIKLIDNILEDIHSFNRIDLENYFKNIQHLWNIYSDIDSTLTDYDRFMSYFEDIEKLQQIEAIVQNREDFIETIHENPLEQRSHQILTYSLASLQTNEIDNENLIEETPDEDIVNIQDLCRNGIDILDSVMSYDDMDSILNEENYRQLMDIFQKIHNS